MKRTKISFKLLTILLCLVTLLSMSGCGESKEAQSVVFAMDTYMTLTAYGKNRDTGLTAAEGVIRSMDSMLDPELSTSIVYALNSAHGETVVVPGQVARMLSTAQTVYRQSGGALDLTIYPLVKLWGFVDGKYYVPRADEIAGELNRLCFDQVVLSTFPATGSNTVTMPESAQISFAAAAKGCAASYAIEAMRNAGVTSAIISLGGNVQTLGLKPDGTRWRIGITDPYNPETWLGTIDVGETAVVTSGSYQRYFTDAHGTVYHHLLRPKTGYPANNTLVSATVICEDGTLADCLSTAMFVLGESMALNYWRTYGGFEMILITNDYRVICTSGLIEEFKLSNTHYTLSYTE